MQAEENYLELKAAAAHFAKAYDEDGMSATEQSGSSGSSSSTGDDDDEDGDGHHNRNDDDGDEARDLKIENDTAGGRSDPRREAQRMSGRCARTQ